MISCICGEWCPDKANYCSRCARPVDADEYGELVTLESQAIQESVGMPRDPFRKAMEEGFFFGLMAGLIVGIYAMILLMAVVTTVLFIRFRKAAEAFNTKYQRLWSLNSFHSSIHKF